MKKFVLGVLAMISTLSMTASPTYAWETCDQTFSPIYLRYGAYHYLQDYASNPNNYPLYVQTAWAEIDTLQYFIGGGKLDTVMNWDLPAKATNVLLMQSQEPVYIGSHPASRTNQDILIKYIMGYDVGNTVTESDDYYHVECQPYIVTWCGDGVRDTQKDWQGNTLESCDDGAQNGQPGKCNTSCNGVTPPTPVNGLCGSASGQTYNYAPTTNLCAIGTASSVTTSNGYWFWSCSGMNGGSTVSCNAFNPPPSASCEPSKTGVQSSPLTQGACAVGSVSNFSSSQNGNTTNYTWSCNNGGANTSCNASYTVVPQTFDLNLKKYIKYGGVEYDAQWGDPVTVVQGEDSASYVIRVRNLGAGVVSGTTTVTDDLPAGIDANGAPVATGWNCSYAGRKLTCTTTAPVTANNNFNDIVVPVKIGITTGYVVNYAYVTNPNENPGNPNRLDDNNDPAKFLVGVVPRCEPAKTGTQTQPLTQGYCSYGSASNFSSTVTNGITYYTWSCVDGGHSTTCAANYTPNPPKFDLSVKKYIQKGGDQDAQTAPGVQSATDDTFTYRIIARNEGPDTVMGETTVEDVLPAGVVLGGTVTSNGWNCSVAGSTITCKITQAVRSGTSFPDIIVPVRVTATSGSVTNIAEVSNPNEDPAKNVSNDPKNKDPAVFTVETGSPKLVIKKYAKSKLTGDSQNAATAVSIKPGETFSYYYVVTNIGNSVAYGSIIKDTLPSSVTIDGAIVAPADYTGCSIVSTPTNPSFYCASAAEIAPGASVEISVPVKLSATAPVSTPIQNIAYVCQKYKTPGVRDEVGCTYDPPPPPPTGCADVASNGEKDPACIIVSGEGFDLAIKKYIGTNDAQPGSPVTVSSGQLINYVIRVQNLGTGSTSGTTTVKDVLPAGSSFVGNASPTGTNWTCATTNITVEGVSRIQISCTTTAVIAKDGYFPDITFPVQIKRTVGDTDTNYAVVHNPNEANPCKTDNSMPSGSEVSCEKDSKNIDPAVVTYVSTGFDLSIKKYAKSEDVFAVIENNEDFNYTVVVQNNGTGATSGVTTVKDVLPNFITLRAQPSGNGWDCSASSGVGGKEVTCTTSAVVDAHQVFNVITIPVRATNASYQANGIVNRAFVHNPNEVAGKRCSADNSMPAGSESQCSEDKNNSDPATVNPPNPNGFDLRLKKYVNGDDEASVPGSNGSVTYTFTVENLGAQPTSGTTTVTDTFPTGVTPTSAAGSGWSCTINNQIVTCTRSDVLAKGAFYPTISVAATVSSTVGTYKNVACLSNPNDPNEGAPYNPANGEYKVNNCDPADVVVVPPGSFDLTIKKKVGKSLTDGTLKDRNTADEGDGEQNILVIAQSGTLVYTFAVTNLGPVTATGTTTVEDTLPNDITIVGTPSGNGWSCSVTGNGNRSFSCNRSDTLTAGNVFPDIVVNAQASSTILAGEYSNTATVRNPGDTNPTNNTDPANVKVMVGASCGGVTASVSSPMAPGTSVTYTCVALGYSGASTNLEYNIKCGASDAGTWTTTGSTRVCSAPNANSATQEISCAVREITNPNVTFSGSNAGSCKINITTTGGGGGGPTAFYIPTCVNGVKACGTKLYTTSTQCNQTEGTTCYTELAACQTAMNALSCGGPGGGCSGPGCGGGGGGTYCGNGVVEAYNGEECDLGTTYNNSQNSVCTSNCKLALRKTTTNPGENPILDIWMNIPTLSNVRLGMNFLDRVKVNSNGEIKFIENEVVIGKGGNVFSIADKINFGVTTEYQIPLIVPANYNVCIYSDNINAITQYGAGSANEYCKPIGSLAQPSMLRTINGSDYVVIGKGTYIQCRTMTSKGCTLYESVDAPGINIVSLFEGNKLINTTTSLRDAFQGANGSARIRLTIANPTFTQNDRPIDLAMPVRVSSALVGSATTTTNRVVNPLSVFESRTLLEGFLSGLKKSTTLSSTTRTNSSTTNTTTTTNNNTVSVRSSTLGNKSVKSLDELLALKTNGNDTILSLSGGDLTIENCPNNTLVIEGVRTVIVEGGNLIIKCNIMYSNGVSSWAFITKGGDIQVMSNVRSIAGVYVAIPTGSTGGNLTGGTQPTQDTLTVEGSLYGKAQGLIASRQYVRGTSTYDLLSSGIILNYSNKALLYPPPLLSSYLSNYTVERVAR